MAMAAMVKQLMLIFGCLILIFMGSSDGTIYVKKDGGLGIGLGLGLGGSKEKCPPTTNFTCPCGPRNEKITIQVPMCSFATRWKHKCKPCEKGNKIEERDLCPKFKGCARCFADGGSRCLECPPGKLGDWCLNDCTCLNGAVCEQNGECTCTENFEGRNCEKKKGCPVPEPPAPPVEAVLTPPDRPVTIVYSCPEDYELKGETISVCNKNHKWSSAPPQCVPKCPLLTAPENGNVEYSSSDLVAGVTAEVTCTMLYRLEGENILTCLPGGKWSSALPVCKDYPKCQVPAKIPNGELSYPPEALLISNWVVANEVFYKCHEGFEQLGATTLHCLPDGTWSKEPPSCVKVSPIMLDCNTLGSEVVAEAGERVRIYCPPECTDEEFHVWGTSIYRMESSVCQAAVHSSKITNSGGLVEVINNGPYSQFTGSRSNGVESDSFEGSDQSFRFYKLPPSIQARDTEECPKGMDKLENICVFISRFTQVESVAKATCTNMGLQLAMPNNPEEKTQLAKLLNSKDITSVWTGKDSDEEDRLSSSGSGPDGLECEAATLTPIEFIFEKAECNEKLHYACIEKLGSTRLASCKDPGILENGKAEPIGQIDGIHYVGSSILYSCNTLYYLKGAKTISCTGSGEWSDAKPICIKVDACEEPPIPNNGFVTYLPPLRTPSDQRAAIARSGVMGTRMARLPTGLAMPLPEKTPNQALPTAKTTPDPNSIELPPGVHRVGTRAMFDCESNYYKLVGSKTRRCQSQGEWSGRPPTCIPICGRSDSPRSPFIVNGNASDIGQWPWQAGIARYLQDYGRWFLLCGGSLLNERWILTAAHCVTYAGTTLTVDADKFQVYLGKYHRTDSKDDHYVQVRKIHEIHIHPDYDPSMFDADIALLQLDSDVLLNTRVRPVCLPTEQTTRENLVEGKRGVVTGWGMNENETYSETLQQAVLPVVSQSVCEKGYEDSELPLTVTDNMYCAGFAQGRSDACSGDSGGPMVFTDESSKERKWVVEGVVSWGSPRGCGNPNQYGGFTTVSRFLEWIHLFL